jgi:hypothetical protein
LLRILTTPVRSFTHARIDFDPALATDRPATTKRRAPKITGPVQEESLLRFVLIVLATLRSR